MGGASRKCRAATFPPDLYWCLLDEPPLHLIPRQWPAFPAVSDKSGLVLNPSARILRVCHPEQREGSGLLPALAQTQIPRSAQNDTDALDIDGQIPPELVSKSTLLGKFALQGSIAWIARTEGGPSMPFWLSPRLEKILAGFISEGRISDQVDNHELSTLIAANLLQTNEQMEREAKSCERAIASAAEMFRERHYAPIRTLIHPFHVAAMRRYFRYLIRRNKIAFGDEQCARRFGVHNDSVARFFHYQLAGTISAIVGETVKPSYVYSACYVGGAELKKHIDRSQCEFSVTFCLDFTPEPKNETSWPVRLETPRGEVVVYQAIGDGLVYRGTRVPHYRGILPQGKTSTSIFFHYVPQTFTGPLD